MSEKQVLKFGVPKGSLEEATDALFARAGWKISKHSPTSTIPSLTSP